MVFSFLEGLVGGLFGFKDKDASPLAQSWIDFPQRVYMYMWAEAWFMEKGLR